MTNFNKPGIARRWTIAASTVAIIASIALPTGAANAAAPAPPATPASTAALAGAPLATTTTTVALQPDCTNVTAQARSYIAAHSLGICGIKGLASGAAAVSPQAAVAIACGYASIKDTPYGSGTTMLTWSITTTVGEMISRALYINWVGSNGSSAGFPDISFMATGSYKNTAVIHSGFNAYASLGGSVQIWYGLVCYAEGIHT